ncbi:hypothetical protein HYY71_05565 [Candidatus Woesearchaeota archaeon]|nr:hypothetical protein [Candidatus Woesearchaeota archaeon]
MLSKNKIDRGLRKYVREHLSKGYSKRSVKHVLVKHGYDENYIDGLLKRHSQAQFVKAYSIFVSLLFVISIFAMNITTITNKPQQITGYAATISGSNEGCCTSICQQTSKAECYGRLIEGKKCNELEECSVGCCIDKEGYCLTNYLSGNCISSYGTNINRDCSDIVFCRNITDKSYIARLYSIKDKKDTGALALNPASDYYKSSFNIRHFLYDKTDVISVIAELRDGAQGIDSIALYDDGSHNDGAANDNLYANNWDSSKVGYFEGVKRLDVSIVVKYADGTQKSPGKSQALVLLNKNKCLPISADWGNANEKHGLIFAAQNYDALDNGQQKFEIDVQNFLNLFFSIDKFSGNKNSLNIYRLEQSLSYANIPTLANFAAKSCPSYSNSKDLVILLDNNEQYCVKESIRIARVNPQVLFYNNISNAEIGNVFADFCDYALTPKKLADEIITFATPPKIIVYTPDNSTYNNSIANFSFSISAANYPINYSLSIGNLSLPSRISTHEVNESLAIALANGTNFIFIKTIDKNRNKAFAQILLNATIQ